MFFQRTRVCFTSVLIYKEKVGLITAACILPSFTFTTQHESSFRSFEGYQGLIYNLTYFQKEFIFAIYLLWFNMVPFLTFIGLYYLSLMEHPLFFMKLSPVHKQPEGYLCQFLVNTTSTVVLLASRSPLQFMHHPTAKFPNVDRYLTHQLTAAQLSLSIFLRVGIG